VDFGTFHLYPEHWGKTPEWGTDWMARHLAVAAQVNKPAVLGEFGIQSKEIRVETYRSWLRTIANGGAGSLVWMLAAEQHGGSLYPDYDGFTIYADSDEADLFRACTQEAEPVE
jgi:mannan endo-1,4-beta-mannosidase